MNWRGKRKQKTNLAGHLNSLSQIQNPRQGPNTRQSAGLFHACVNHCNDGSLRRFYYNIMCTEKGRSSVVASIVAAFEKRKKKKKGLYFIFENMLRTVGRERKKNREIWPRQAAAHRKKVNYSSDFICIDEKPLPTNATKRAYTAGKKQKKEGRSSTQQLTIIYVYLKTCKNK